MKVPKGFEVAGITVGVKRSGRPDLGIIYSAAPLVWAYSATTNAVVAPCVVRDRSLAASGKPVRALVINSGNANCANGEGGEIDDLRLASAAAEALGLSGADEVLSASTGVIGHAMPIDKLVTGLPQAAAARGDDSEGLARAILTTDLVAKEAVRDLAGGARVLGVAKGSGMIHPNMATLLTFVMTDAKVDQDALRAMWSRVVDRSFNQVTVDGDTSTNDMAIVFSSGLVAADLKELEAALLEVASSLAKQVARDGEGATKLITVRMTGAKDEVEARRAARTVAGSNLVKAAVHGSDPNWGRILAAVGRANVALNEAHVRVLAQGFELYYGEPQPFDAKVVSDALRSDDVLLEADLGVGSAQGEAWGCDLSEGYVRINADYTT